VASSYPGAVIDVGFVVQWQAFCRPTAPTSSSTPTQPRRLSSSQSGAWPIRTARTRTKLPSSPKRCGRQPTETPDLAKGGRAIIGAKSNAWYLPPLRAEEARVEPSFWQISGAATNAVWALLLS
jgi:hypothetical protein